MPRLPRGPPGDEQKTPWSVMESVLDTSSVENLVGLFCGGVSPMRAGVHANV